MKRYRVLLFIVILGLTSSCKIVRSIGETIGIVDEKPKQEEVQHNPANPVSVKGTDEVSKVNLGKWLFWSVLVLSAVMGVRYAVLRGATENRK